MFEIAVLFITDRLDDKPKLMECQIITVQMARRVLFATYKNRLTVEAFQRK
jgi:hypothetical protein